MDDDVAPFEGKLEFVAGADMWAVAPTGDWAEDNRTGSKYAGQIIKYIQDDHHRLPLLGHILREMVRKARFGAIEVGFSHRIAVEFLAASRSARP